MTAARASQRPPDQYSVLLATVDTLPQPYEILGLVEATMAATNALVPTARLMDKLEEQALALGADAVIGIRVSRLTLPAASKARWFGQIEHYGNTVVAIALGTAVRQHPT